MRSLDLPTRNTTEDLDTVIARANPAIRPLLLHHRTDVLNLFLGYSTNQGWDFETVQDLTHLPPEVRTALRKSYALVSPKRKLGDLRAELLQVSDNLCPYCRLEAPYTLDHFLPKSLHKPFASYAHNLIPMCITCNRFKGTKGKATGRQFFTHAYFDQLAKGERFMVAQVAVGARHIATNFLIDFSANLDAQIFQRLAYQFAILRLVPRYQLAAIDVINEQAEKLKDMVNDGCHIEECRISIAGDANTEAANFGQLLEGGTFVCARFECRFLFGRVRPSPLTEACDLLRTAS